MIAIARGGLLLAGAISLRARHQGVRLHQRRVLLGHRRASPRAGAAPADARCAARSAASACCSSTTSPTPVARSRRSCAIIRDEGAEVRTATLYTKSHTVLEPDFDYRRTDDWIVFPWSALPPVDARARAPRERAPRRRRVDRPVADAPLYAPFVAEASRAGPRRRSHGPRIAVISLHRARPRRRPRPATPSLAGRGRQRPARSRSQLTAGRPGEPIGLAAIADVDGIARGRRPALAELRAGLEPRVRRAAPAGRRRACPTSASRPAR